MSMVTSEPEALEELRDDLTQIAIETGAMKLAPDDGETLLSQGDENAERHAYALATIDCNCGRWNADIPEMKEVMRSILEGAAKPLTTRRRTKAS
jgi:hypothetical protein